MNSSKTAIIIVNYKTSWHLRKCLESLFKFTEDFHLYLVHNSSDTASYSVGKEFAERYPHQVTEYKNKENLGFVGGVNTPYTEAIKHKRICLVNSDTVLTENWLKLMSEEMDNNPKISQIVPDSNSYYSDSIFWKIIKSLPAGLSKFYLYSLYNNPKKASEQRGFKADNNFLAIAGGFCTLFDSKYAQARGYILDPKLAHGYWDDLELTIYLRQFGDIGSTNKAYVFHFTNASFQLLGKRRVDPQKTKLSDLNGFYVFQKWNKYLSEHIAKMNPDELYERSQDRILAKVLEYFGMIKMNAGFEKYIDSLPAWGVWEEMRRN